MSLVYEFSRLPGHRVANTRSDVNSSHRPALAYRRGPLHAHFTILDCHGTPLNLRTMAYRSTVDLHECLEFVTGLVRQVGEIINLRIDQKKKISTKGSNIDFVTETDQEVEKFLIEGISQKYPEHNFIGEESFAAGKKEKLTSKPTWIIDPVDGTTNFMHSYPNVCISIALMVDYDMQMGIIFNPVLDMFFRAIKGEGAFLNDEPIKVSGVKKLSDALVALEYGSNRSENIRKILDYNTKYLASKAHGIRASGSAAWNLAQVARGGIDVYMEMGIHAWDMAAGEVIVKEAGGYVLDPSGDAFRLMHRRILATSSREIAEEVYPELVHYYPESD